MGWWAGPRAPWFGRRGARGVAMAAGRAARCMRRAAGLGCHGGACAGALVLACLSGSAPLSAWAQEVSVDGQVPPWEPLETPFGTMRLREFGSTSDPLVVLVHGMMDSDVVREEWNPVALQLAAAGFHVLLPDFHSGPEELRPGRLTADGFRELMQSTLLHQNEQVPSRYKSAVKAKAVVMGKSWGAYVAAEAAAGLEEVVATALVVPALHAAAAEELFPKIQGRLGVFLVKDDAVVDFEHTSKALRAVLGDRRITWVVAESGGHQLVQEFVAPLVRFVEESWRSLEHEEGPPGQRLGRTAGLSRKRAGL